MSHEEALKKCGLDNLPKIEEYKGVKQPKFKFGERVKCGGLNPFIIERIQLLNGMYSYSDKEDPDCFKPEPYIELYQEPKAKKLYAYGVYGNGANENLEIKLFKKEISIFGTYFKRDSEYDIEYPVKVTEK